MWAADRSMTTLPGSHARTGLSLRTIRHYEETGLVIPSARSRGGFRLYTESDVGRPMAIRRMKPLGFALDEMRDLLERRTASTRARSCRPTSTRHCSTGSAASSRPPSGEWRTCAPNWRGRRNSRPGRPVGRRPASPRRCSAQRLPGPLGYAPEAVSALALSPDSTSLYAGGGHGQACPGGRGAS